MRSANFFDVVNPTGGNCSRMLDSFPTLWKHKIYASQNFRWYSLKNEFHEQFSSSFPKRLVHVECFKAHMEPKILHCWWNNITQLDGWLCSLPRLLIHQERLLIYQIVPCN